MNKKLCLVALSLLTALALPLNVNAQSKVSLRLQSTAESYVNNESKASTNCQRSKIKRATPKTSDIISVTSVLADGAQIPYQQLSDMGITVDYTAHNIVGLSVPVEAVSRLDELDEFESFNTVQKFHINNNYSQKQDSVFNVQNAECVAKEKLPKAFTGEGVVVGVFDKGIDFNHANFRDPQTNKTRIKRAILCRNYLYCQDGILYQRRTKGDTIKVKPTEVMEIYSNPADIDTLTTDCRTGSHGTHTSSTAAGSYEGTYHLNKTDSILSDNYRGVAYKADLILAGDKDITEPLQYLAMDSMDRYATEHNQPLVVNLSLGIISNWYDGLIPTCKYFDSYTNNGNKPGRIVCVSSGNFADVNYTIYKDVKANEPLYTCISSKKYLEKQPDGTSKYVYRVTPYVNVYSTNTTDTFSVDVQVYNTKTGKSLPVNTHKDLKKDKCLKSDFDKTHGGRYYVELLNTDYKDPDNPQDSVLAILKITSPVDTKIRVISTDVENYPVALITGPFNYTTAGNSESSINSTVCTNSVISVGLWNNEDKIYMFYKPGWSLTEYGTTGFPLKDICNFSSYIISDDNGVSRPDIAAPGYDIMSGLNCYNTRSFDANGYPRTVTDDNWKYTQEVSALAVQETGRKDGRHSALGYMSGTSMACPNTAGIIALWLQANPQLTQNQVKEVLRQTSSQDQYTDGPHKVRFGYGKINALAGLKYILKNFPTPIHEVVNGEPKGIDEPNIKKVILNGKIVIINGGHQYSVTGQQLQ